MEMIKFPVGVGWRQKVLAVNMMMSGCDYQKQPRIFTQCQKILSIATYFVDLYPFDWDQASDRCNHIKQKI